MEILREVFSELGHLVFGSLGYLLDRLFADASYRQGFGACILFLLVLTVLTGIVLYSWRRVIAYFTATAPPPPPVVPPPAETGMGCLGGVLVLLALGVIVVGMLWGIVG